MVDDEVRKLLNDAHIIAGKILKKFKKQMDAMVKQLMEKETLNKDEVAEVFKSIKNGYRKIIYSLVKLQISLLRIMLVHS